MARVLGLVNLHSSPDISPITDNRVVGTLNLLGRYAYIDIALSNFTNSGINTVGVLVNKSARSVIKHMEGAMSYSNNTKLGKTVICLNEKYANNPLYNTDINNMIENMWLLEEQNFKYVVIAPAHILYTMDFTKVIEEHEKKNAEITCVYSKFKNAKEELLNQVVIDINKEDGRVQELRYNLGVHKYVNLFLQTYVINKDKLIEIIKLAQKTSKIFDLQHIVDFISREEFVNTYEFKGYYSVTDSMERYLDENLKGLNFETFELLIDSDWPIYTKTYDTPPARYLADAWVRKSIISNGAIIDGKVENSVVCRGSKIGNKAYIKNSIISSGAEIVDNAVLEYVIVDKNAKILNVKELKGTKEHPLYVAQGDII